MKSTTKADSVKNLVPVLSKGEKQEIVSYYRAYEKHEAEITELATEELKDHPVFGKLIRDIPKDVAEAQNKISQQLQKDAIMNNNWQPFIEFQLIQGSTYAKMGLDFKTWYEVIVLARKYLTPCLNKEYANTPQLLQSINGMNRFMDIGMALIGEAYLREKQEIIESEQAKIIKLNRDLEQKVNERTDQLQQSINEILRVSNDNQDLYDHAPCGYLSVDLSLTISSINVTLLGWLGYSLNEVVGKMKFEDLLCQKSKETYLKNLTATYSEFISKGFINDREYDFKRKDKTTFNVIINATAVFNEKGEFIRSRTIVNDNTFRKKAEHDLREANFELEAQAQKLQASDEELRVQQEELMQSNQELEEKSQLLEEKNQIVSEKNEELEAASFELTSKAEELALSSKYKSEFLANMSHELRTPLNSILLLSRLLADNSEKNLTGEQIEFATVIHNSGNGLLDLINEILDLSKIESGKMEIDIEDVALSIICKNVHELFIPVAKERSLSFIIKKDDSIPASIKTDRIRTEQVLKNFVSNALKFTEKGSVELIVRMPDKAESDSLKINRRKFIAFEIKDTGIGIPKEKHSLVFEAFQQADGSTRRKYGGTGLGLSISKEISHMLGGEILLKSEPGKGSSFTLIIPVDLESTETPGTAEISNANKKRKFDELKSELLSGLSDKSVLLFTPEEIPDDRLTIGAKDKAILIVEDDTTFAAALKKSIQERGYKVVVAVSGADAVHYALKYNPVGILLDIQLPVKNGWTVMKELKDNPVTRHIPVHLMSSLDIKSNETISLGAVDFINKPIAEKKLGVMLDRIESILGESPKTILLIDNNSKHTKALNNFISDFSIKCITASTAKKAYEVLKKDRVDCVVLDMGFPDEIGYEILDTLKKDKKFEKLPVVIYTGKSLSLHEEKKLKQYERAVVLKTADSFNSVASQITIFLHLVENRVEGKTQKKPYLKDKILIDKHILIVDDDVRNIFSLTKLLEGQKMKVSSACDGNEALEILRTNQDIDLVLMDMMMPHKDGYETTIDIRKEKLLKNTKVIAVTAKAMLGNREKCISAGVNDYITKPVDVDQLLALLRIWLYE